MNKESKGRLIIISSPSGGGKGTIIKRLLELRPGLCYSVSATTRCPRVGDVDGVTYHFVSHEHFIQMINNNELLEYAKYVDEFYGTPKKYVKESIDKGKDIILEIEVEGAKQIIELIPDALSVFIVPPSIEELERRLRGRGTDSEEKIKNRLQRARKELEKKSLYSYTVVNDEVDRAANEILSILDSN